ncbi:unnamed protein product, partial [Callosobruchus maculatus]
MIWFIRLGWLEGGKSKSIFFYTELRNFTFSTTMSYAVCSCFSKLRLPFKQSIRLYSNITKLSNSFLWRPTHDFASRRSLFRFFNKKPNKEELKIKDNIPDHYKLIYLIVGLATI